MIEMAGSLLADALAAVATFGKGDYAKQSQLAGSRQEAGAGGNRRRYAKQSQTWDGWDI
jgi:hypothetical protein